MSPRFDGFRLVAAHGADNRLLGTSDDEQGLALEALPGRRYIEPTVLVDRLRGEIGGAIASAHDIATAHMQFAGLRIGYGVIFDQCRRCQRLGRVRTQHLMESLRKVSKAFANVDRHRGFRQDYLPGTPGRFYDGH
jgi:hypothetical protein